MGRPRGVIAKALPTGGQPILAAATEILAEERGHAEQTGDHIPLLLSLTRFANATLDPKRARAWADEAVEWGRSDPQAWLALVEAHMRQPDISAAIETGFIASDLFPDDFYLMDAIGTALRHAGRLDEAEELFRHSLETSDGLAEKSWDGLGFVLGSDGSGLMRPARTIGRRASVSPRTRCSGLNSSTLTSCRTSPSPMRRRRCSTRRIRF